MTNAELIEKIRAEIERLENYYTSVEWYVEELLSFLSTLESEKPMEQEDLNDEIKKYIEEYGYEKGADKLLIAIVARHFAKWGAEHSGSSEIPNDLEEAAKAYALDTSEDSEQYSARYLGYKDGAKWQKEQMMKEAVEGVVMDFSSNKPRPQVDVYVDPNKYCTGDKVRIIVIPNTDKK